MQKMHKVRRAVSDDIHWIKPMIDRYRNVFGFIPRLVFVNSIEKGELLVVAHKAFCRYHTRRDGVSVIYEILSEEPSCGTALLAAIPRPITAKCPVGEASNSWYERMGFIHNGLQDGKRRDLNIWRLEK